MNIIKRTGETVPFDVDRIHRVVGWAVNDIKGVTASDIEINAKLQMKEGITTREIHNVLIDSAVNLISLNTPNYQYVASRLLSYQLRKDVWGGKNPPKFFESLGSLESGVFNSSCWLGGWATFFSFCTSWWVIFRRIIPTSLTLNPPFPALRARCG